MKYSFIIFLVVLLLFSCAKQSSPEVERISITPHIISNDVYSSLPGTVLVYENELVWLNHSSTNNFIHVLDKRTGEEKITFGSIGGGPEEVFTPDISQATNRQLLVYDLNSPKILAFSLDSVLSGKVKPTKIKLSDDSFDKNKLLEVDENKFILFGLGGTKPFLLMDKDNSLLFGEYPIKTSVDIINKFDVFQGSVLYSHQNKKLLYSAGDMSYVSLYEYSNGGFELKWEKTLSNVEYTISDNLLQIFKTPQYAPTALTMTKDYIISIERDEEQAVVAPVKKTAMRDFSRLPQSLFIYDYDMNLKKIVNVGLPIIRISSDGKTNDIYFIGANPEICIGMVAL